MLKVWFAPPRGVSEREAKRAMREFERDHGDVNLPGIHVGGARYPGNCAGCGGTVWDSAMYAHRTECDQCRKQIGFR